MSTSSHPGVELLRFLGHDWKQLVDELGQRGEGKRESGAFLLAAPGSDVPFIERCVYFDDIDPNALRGRIAIDGRAFSALWDICDHSGLVVVGDVHTHPGPSVRQSRIDAGNPMVARVGHVAFIFPHLARRPLRPDEVGVHLYRGDAGWRSWVRRRCGDTSDDQVTE